MLELSSVRRKRTKKNVREQELGIHSNNVRTVGALLAVVFVFSRLSRVANVAAFKNNELGSLAIRSPMHE